MLGVFFFHFAFSHILNEKSFLFHKNACIVMVSDVIYLFRIFNH